MASEITISADRPWLDDLIAKYGECKIAPGPVMLHSDGEGYVRECWAWLIAGRNSNLAIDRYGNRWVVAASGPKARIKFESREMPTANEIMAMLVCAGMLEACDG